jgi:hypothetical protein
MRLPSRVAALAIGNMKRRTFDRCKLGFAERETNRFTYLLHEDLLRLRREMPAFSSQRRGQVDGAVLSAHAFVLRFGATPRRTSDSPDAYPIFVYAPLHCRVSGAERGRHDHRLEPRVTRTSPSNRAGRSHVAGAGWLSDSRAT